MKVAALYDVHGMPWALEAALAEVDADTILCGGDVLDGPFPERCVDLLQRAGARFIRGNSERELADGALAWLATTPLTETIDGVVYCHATPDDDMPMTTERTPDDLITERFGAGTTVIGHTHHQFDRRVGEIRVVNAGSVGMPYEDDVAAFWLLVDDGEPQFRRTPFDVDRAVSELRASDWPGAEQFVAENLLSPPSRAEAVEFFESQNG